eukprot:1190334-Prorocentrum_minimum.AAC.2
MASFAGRKPVLGNPKAPAGAVHPPNALAASAVVTAGGSPPGAGRTNQVGAGRFSLEREPIAQGRTSALRVWTLLSTLLYPCETYSFIRVLGSA